MTVNQIKSALENTYVDSPSLKGVVFYDGVNWFCNEQQIKPSKAQVKQVYSEHLKSQSEHFNEHINGLFYEL